MLLNTLSAIEMTIQQKLNKNVDNTALINFFRNYKKNMWIYPGVLKRKFSLSISEIYDFLSALEEQGILQSYYELYCSNCQKSMGVVRLFNELPDFFECELCHCELSTLENSFLIYLVVRDD
ncbi:hypothetical protein [Lachnoclostridium sp. An181]|uniref:hypothetical protein n=1 Tax=Lachnoclostridium sp. An181 TaxID=1965575 RepID=UPI000B3AA83C|nr:hypothetical protein [Lachnoclostridium sp. An181]OUP49920.1 hypothetical protein B5F18_05380 [Lachnoclostridium sp. An181]